MADISARIDPGMGSPMPPPDLVGPMSDVLELEHMIGFTGIYPGSIVAHPRLPEVIVKAVGSAIVIADVNDPHQQEFLHGHDMEISAIALSDSGNLLASGQLGTTHRKGYEAPVIVWDMNTRQNLFTFRGHTGKVNLLRFSPDERFVCSCGSDSILYIWDLQTGEIVLAKKFASPICIFQWCDIHAKGRRATYEVALACNNDVMLCELRFDATRQQWQLDRSPVMMPTAGMVREYTCCSRSADGDELMSGSNVGDLIVFKLPSKVYRASVPVCSGGLRALVVARDGRVYCGGGDGTISRLKGDDMRWTLQATGNVHGGVTSLSMMATGEELIVGTDSGRVYRMSMEDLSSTELLSQSHTASVTTVAFGLRSDVFASASLAGDVTVWDLSDYSVIAEANVSSRGAPEQPLDGHQLHQQQPEERCYAACLAWVGDSALISGWTDQFLRCHDASSMRELWSIPNAHRGPVRSVAVHSDASQLAYLCSGGDDGSVRVWSLRTREVMLQFAEHKGAVTSVLVDAKQPNLIHSAALDCQVLSYDLKRERRTVAHMVREGAFTGMTQRLDSEQELVTCDMSGRLLFWDCDVSEPVQALQSPTRMHMRCASVSPSGRFLAICGNLAVNVFDLRGGIQMICEGEAHSSPPKALAWSPDEKQLVSVGEDSCVCVWNFYGDVDEEHQKNT